MNFDEKFIEIASLAIKRNKVINVPNAENVILWPKMDAMIRFTSSINFDSIAIESEKHGLYAYWSPGFAPVFLDCDEEAFKEFYNLVIDDKVTRMIKS